jgi:hypothetical protein
MLSACEIPEKTARKIPVRTRHLNLKFINGTLPAYFGDDFILQYFVKIANYANNVFKNIARCANLILKFPYLSKFIVDSLKFGFCLFHKDWNFQYDRLRSAM